MSSQRELFCRLVALRGYTQTDAYREAYQSEGSDQNCAVKASLLMREAEVQERIKRLQHPELAKEAFTVEGHMAQLASLRDEAIGQGQLGPAVAAEQLRGKVKGAYVDRTLTAQAKSLAELVAGSLDAEHDSPPPAK